MPRRRRAPGAQIGALLSATLALAGALAVAAPARAAVDLIGTWHVLVHYKDSATANPDVERWSDRVWVFEMEGDRLRWTDYPIVVFEDETGRFEKDGNRLTRVLSYWEPNAAQAAQIRAGLEINSRGSKSKTLRGSAAKGWSSAGPGARSYQSARFVTYEETWTIDGADLPKFEIRDSMGSASTDTFEGRTVYATEKVLDDGDVLTGSFDRDGTRTGSFRLTRSGATQRLKTKYASDGERAYAVMFGEAGRQLYKGELPGQGQGSEAKLRAKIAAGEFTDADRAELQEQFEGWVRGQYEAQTDDVRAFEPQIQSLAKKMVVLVVDEGKGIDEVGRMMRDGELRP